MIRVLVFVLIVFLLAAGVAWLADRPGALVLIWQGYEIRSSVLVATVALAVLIGAILVVWSIIRWVISAPKLLGRFFGERRRDRGYRALSNGMIAVGAGDKRLALRSADQAKSLLGEEPLVLLLSAQAAQLAGDPDRARIAFEALERRPDTRLLGLHGLFIEARRQGEHAAARHFAEAAATAAPRIAWAGMALFEYQSRAGDWLGGLRTLSANTDAKLIDRAEARRLRAVLLTARALELEAGDPEEARALALEATRLRPALVEAAVIAGRLYSRSGDTRRAAKVLEAAWKVLPHPEIAEAYAAVRPGDSMRDRLKRMRRLADLRPNHAEGALAVARAAIDAHDWPAGRAALEGLIKASPSERACLLMAEIEEGEHGDQGRVRFWLTRALTAPRDPAWVADGQVFPHWAPLSPVSGRLGAFEWKVVAAPPPQEAVEIEAAAAGRPLSLPDGVEKNRLDAEDDQEEEVAEAPEIQAASPPPPPSPSPPPLQTPPSPVLPTPVVPREPPASRPGLPNPPPEPAPILLHAPDDPGPTEPPDPPRRRFRLF